MNFLFFPSLMHNMVVLQLAIKRNISLKFLIIKSEIATPTHNHLPQNILIARPKSANKVFQKQRFIQSRVTDQLPTRWDSYPLYNFTLYHLLPQPLTRLRQLVKDPRVIRYHNMNQIISQMIYITKHPILKANPRKTYRIPNLWTRQTRLTLNQRIQQKYIRCC